jgi:ABC-type branched-subunit amino acid transport system substrate-binding protein
MSDINLKHYIQKLIDIEYEEEKYKNKCSQLKKEKDLISDSIINYLEKNNITDKDIIYGNSKIKYQQTKIQEGITKKLIQERLKHFLNNENLAINATNFIYSDRNSEIKKSLKILNATKNK